MVESGVMTVAAGWAVLAGIILCSLAFFAAALDAALSARAQGGSGEHDRERLAGDRHGRAGDRHRHLRQRRGEQHTERHEDDVARAHGGHQVGENERAQRLRGHRSGGHESS